MDEAAILASADWLAQGALSGRSEGDLVEGLCRRLLNGGMPLWRVAVSIETLHPVLAGHMFIWNRDMPGVKEDTFNRSDVTDGDDAEWKASPFYHANNSAERRVTRKLGESYRQGEFPMMDDLVHRGMTEYVAIVTPFGAETSFGSMDGLYSSWTTDREGGFRASDHAAIERLARHVAVSVKNRALARVASTLMATYLGRDAGARVLKGNIDRGIAEPLRAVLWMSDLAGFTKVADRIDPAELIKLLNAYADTIVSAVHANQGEVLKFMGDGLLAIFPDAMAERGCAQALAAADSVLTRIKAMNLERAQAGLPVAEANIALHEGNVYYGNIGSLDRLDYTVIGPAVNELSRIEGLCGSLDRHVIVSSAFAQACGANRQRLVSVGRFALRGVEAPQELFTLDPTWSDPLPIP